MSYDSRVIANAFLGLAESRGLSLTPMHILKLVYLAHGWNLAIEGEPLIQEKVEAWQYGPVIPEVYESFKIFGKGNIEGRAETDESEGLDKDEETKKLVEKVFDVYGKYEAFQLSAMTHKKGTPWWRVWEVQNEDEKEGKIPQGLVIPNEMIREHFLKLVGEKTD